MNSILIVVLIYLIIIFAIAWHFSRRESTIGYFLNNKSTGIWLLTLSTVSSVIGAGATVGIISEVYNTGISYGIALPISFVVGMVIMAFFAKRIKETGDSYGAYTISDYFQGRFGSNSRMVVSIVQVIMMIVWAAVQVVAFASLASVLTGMSYFVALGLAALVTIIYTAVGGLKVDMITDFIQFWIIVAVFLVMLVFGLNSVGGLNSLVASVPAGHFDPFAFGGISWFVGVVVLSGLLYIGQATHWQRTFAAKNIDVARKSYLFTVPIVAAIAIIIVVLGLIARVLLGDGSVPEQAPFELMKSILPTGLIGVGFAAILAVIMSSIDSILIGGSTIIYRELNNKYKNTFSLDDVFKARIVTAIFGGLAFILAFAFPKIVSLSLLSAYFAILFIPAVLAGFYSKKISSTAVSLSLAASSVLLALLFPFMQENSFIIPTLAATLIVLFYDKFKRV